MDRFIASIDFYVSRISLTLKSNMDRFIDALVASEMCEKFL